MARQKPKSKLSDTFADIYTLEEPMLRSLWRLRGGYSVMTPQTWKDLDKT